MSDHSEISRLDTVSLARRIRTRELSAVEVIEHAVLLYHCLSLRDVETILVARSVIISSPHLAQGGRHSVCSVRT